MRKALRRMDLNLDGKVDYKDRDSFGFSDPQWRMFLFTATLLGHEIQTGRELPTDLSGKKVIFTAVADKAKMNAWAKEMGATIVSSVSKDVDFVIVGAAGQTGKDERAMALNNLGVAEIEIANVGAFLNAASRAGVTGPAAASMTRAAYSDSVDATLKEYYLEFLTGNYEDELSYATTPAERQSINARWKEDKDTFDPSMIDPDENFDDWIDGLYDSDEPYTDKFGVAVPRDEIDVLNFSFFTEAAGIGLSKTFVIDRRNGNVLDEGDLQD